MTRRTGGRRSEGSGRHVADALALTGDNDCDEADGEVAAWADNINGTRRDGLHGAKFVAKTHSGITGFTACPSRRE